MKINKATYIIDDGLAISGVLVERFLRKPVFYSTDSRLDGYKQTITESEKSKIVLGQFCAGPDVSREFCNVDGAAQSNKASADAMYNEAIKATIASGKADEILKSDKAQSLLNFENMFKTCQIKKIPPSKIKSKLSKIKLSNIYIFLLAALVCIIIAIILRCFGDFLAR